METTVGVLMWFMMFRFLTGNKKKVKVSYLTSVAKQAKTAFLHGPTVRMSPIESLFKSQKAFSLCWKPTNVTFSESLQKDKSNNTILGAMKTVLSILKVVSIAGNVLKLFMEIPK